MHPVTRPSRLLVLVAVSGLVACGSASDPVKLAAPVPMALETGPASEGLRLNRGADGQIILSWTERLSGGGGALHFAALEGDAWGFPETVVSDPHMFVNWADTPSVISLGDDKLFAHWLSKTGDATYAYGIQVSHSTDDGGSWSTPVVPHTDATPTEHGFVSILPHAKTSQLIWLDGRKMVNGPASDVAAHSMTLRAASVDANGTIADEQLIDDIVCDCCSTDMANTASGRVAVYRNRTRDEIRDIYVSRFMNGAWEEGVPVADDGWEIAGCPVNGPAVATLDDLVAIAWFTAANKEPKVQLRLSQDGGQSFGEALLISADHVMGQVDVEIVDDDVAISWLAENAQSTGDIRLAIVSGAAISSSTTVGTTNYPRAVPRLALQNNRLLLAWIDREDDENHVRSVRIPVAR